MRKALAICLIIGSILCMLPISAISVAAGTVKISALVFRFAEVPAVGKKIVFPKLESVNGDTALLDVVDTTGSFWSESEVALSFASFEKVKKDAKFEKGKAYKLRLDAVLAAGYQYDAGCTVQVYTPSAELVGVGITASDQKQHEVMINFGAPTNYITLKSYAVTLHGFALGNDTYEITADVYVNGKKRSQTPLKMNVGAIGIHATTDPDKMTLLYERIQKNKQYYVSVVIEEIPNYTIEYDDLSKFTVNGIKAFKKRTYTDRNGTHYTLLFKLPVLHTHTYTTKYDKATLSANGKQYKACSVCGRVASNSTTVIKKIQSVKLQYPAYAYNGKAQTPRVIVKDSAGKTVSASYYTVKYATGRKNVGKYKVTVTFKGKYKGTKTLYFTIKPRRTTISKLRAGKKSVRVYIKRQTPQVTGYQIQYATSKTFRGAKTKTLSNNKTTVATLSGLSAKKTYYVRVRTYQTVGGVRYYAGWSAYTYTKTK